jgi:hypothetical protein
MKGKNNIFTTFKQSHKPEECLKLPFCIHVNIPFLKFYLDQDVLKFKNNK